MNIRRQQACLASTRYVSKREDYGFQTKMRSGPGALLLQIEEC
jgi:hypothetical protein